MSTSHHNDKESNLKIHEVAAHDGRESNLKIDEVAPYDGRESHLKLHKSLSKQKEGLEKIFYLTLATFGTTFLIKANMSDSSIFKTSSKKVNYMTLMTKNKNVNLFISIIIYIFENYTIIVRQGCLSYFYYFFKESHTYMHLIQENAVHVSLFMFEITNIYGNDNPELKTLLAICKIPLKFTSDRSIILTQFNILIILDHLTKHPQNTSFVNGIIEASASSATIQPELAMRNVLLYMLKASTDIMSKITIATAPIKKRKMGQGQGKVIHKYINNSYLTRRKLKKNKNQERLDKKETRKNGKLSRNRLRNLPNMRYTRNNRR